jgi:hypothetical protein
MDLLDDFPDKNAGLVLWVVGLGHCVLHNYWGLPTVFGCNRLIRPAKMEGEGTCLETLPAFLSAIKTIWAE